MKPAPEPRLQRLALALFGSPLRRPQLLVQALTHRSAGANNNERLEFLGDAVLGLVIAEALLARFPEASEGDLSRRRATLVNQDALARIARRLTLGDHLILGSGELRTGGHARDSILADACEALLGAVYLDQGYEAVRRLILDWFAEPLAEVGRAAVSKDPKTRLQEWLQARRLSLPEYTVLHITGDDHSQCFHVRCRLREDGRETEGTGSTRRRAEQQAAEAMLAALAGEGLAVRG